MSASQKKQVKAPAITSGTASLKEKQDSPDAQKEDSEKDITSEEDLQLQARDQVKQLQLHKLILNKEQLFDKIKQLVDQSVTLIDRSLFQESNFFLEQAEEIIEFAANRGKQIDRNLIIAVLYNRACSYQGLWKLDKCNKYIDAVIYNVESSLKNETWHNKAIETSKKAIKVLEEVFAQLLSITKERVKSSDSLASTSVITTSQKINKSDSNSPRPTGSQENQFFESTAKSLAKEEIQFEKLIPKQALQFQVQFEGKNIFDTSIPAEGTKQLKKARQSIYSWKNNPENNEKNMRQELKVQNKNTDDDNRNILGISKNNEWIEQFNIGSIMHMNSVSYEEFSIFDDILFELSKKQLIERMLFLSICFFTIATEIRFVELDLQKTLAKGQQYDLMKQEAYQQSEIYHLKSIEIVCQAVTCYSPYITHLINSYHKHYNASLDMIEEEVSILSQVSHTEEQLLKYRDQSNSKHEQLDLAETSDTNDNHRINDEILPKDLLQNNSKQFVPQQYIYSSKPAEQLSKTAPQSQLTHSQNISLNQQNTDANLRKKSPQNGQTNNLGLINGQKRPASQHASSTEANEVGPMIQTIKINKNNPAFQKKAPQLDLETLSSGNGQTSQPSGGSAKIIREPAPQGSLIRKSSPVNSEDSRKTQGIRSKENLVLPPETKYSQNNMNQFQILQNGSPRQNQSQIKTIFQGKGSPTSQQGQPQQYSPQNQSASSNQLPSQQGQFQQMPQQQLTSQQQQMQQNQYILQQQLQQQQQQGGQYLKQISNNKIQQQQISPTNTSILSQSQQIMPGQIASQSMAVKGMSNSAIQLQIQNAQINQKGNRNINEPDFRIHTSDPRYIEDKSGNSTYRSTGQNYAASKSIPSSSPDGRSSNNSLLKGSNSQRNIQTTANQQKSQSQNQQQLASQPPGNLKIASTTVQSFKNTKPGEMNHSPKQVHNFLNQFDFISPKNPGFSPVNSKEFSNPQTINSARGSPPNTSNPKGIPKLDFNQIPTPLTIKTDENVRFFSARDNSAKKINNFVTKAN